MPSYNLEILGLTLSFKTDAEPDRVEAAKIMVEERCKLLGSGGKALGKEKLLAFVALGLADDVLMSNQRLGDVMKRAGTLLKKIEG
ncbi:cell division protein ZapA [Desulfolutivibrio sulfoxidireducens]|uniref:cell division protein ZapA n=1 Tax=Desulfolutivibrio sulfoxidireducens TaxID=2773299 RepID=UPI00159E0CB6|nr:cell division protein ZapA [Desulfolutivibrio sulfoxidireducens]QLA15186.1 cell division protein ZapA [Desulfolutivibrio sulfoxidireducens]QLA18757.1 cell division protein ZapA [Desulfolutivibrio sulfoxidireducens]